jgi:hypothetical protein
LRIKEQETRLTLQEHNDDDDYDVGFTVRDFYLQRRTEHASNSDEDKLGHVCSILISPIR